jgi:hypothetical protein
MKESALDELMFDLRGVGHLDPATAFWLAIKVFDNAANSGESTSNA